jgi:hypothetical protein
MKLSLINENISKKDFFDFYALLHAYNDGSHPAAREISQRLKHLVNEIYLDHINQLSIIVFSRCTDLGNEDTVALLKSHGITFGDDYEIYGIEDLDTQDRAKIMSWMIKNQPHHGFTGDTWYDLAQSVINLSNVNGLSNRILAIDKMYGLMHHGGLITDYMDESKWIEDALNTRDNANPNQILGQSSRDVRSLIGPSSYHGESRSSVDDIDKLYTAFRRVTKNKKGIIVTKESNDTLRIDGQFTRDKIKNWNVPVPSWGGVISDTGYFEYDGFEKGDMQSGRVWVEDTGKTFNIVNDINNVHVLKPIRSYHSLADDVLFQVAKPGKTLSIGMSIGGIKKKY